MSSFLRRMMMAAAMNKAIPTTYLTDDVKAYATSFGVLDGLNEYIGEHPKMIKYINEWKYIIHSLGLGTGYTSWLDTNGARLTFQNYYIYPNSQIYIKCIIKANTEHLAVLGSGSVWNNNSTTFTTYYNCSNKRLFDRGNGEFYTVTEGVVIEIFRDASLNSATVNNEIITTNVKKFSGEKSNSCLYCDCNEKINQIKYSENGGTWNNNFLPYYDSKTKKFGMLDVSADTPKFYGAEPNTGEFTWSLTDENGNEVLSFKETDLPKCLVDACFSYGISTANMESAYDIDNDIVKSFNGVGRGITSQALSWIDTEYVAQKSSEFVLDCIFLTKDTLGWCSLFGAETTEGGTDSFLIRRKASRDALLGAFGKYDSSNGDYGNFRVENVFDNRHIITFNKNGISVDGGICDIITPFNEDTYSPSNLTIYLFALNNNGSIVRKGNTTLYSLVINEDGKKKGYFIPIISNGEKCLYDLIEGKVHHDKHTSNEFIIQ